MEPGETAAGAAVREAREECGLTVRVGAWAARAVEFVHAPAEGAHFEKRSEFLEARVCGPTAPAGEPGHELRWVQLREAATRLSPASHRWAVAEWLGRVGAPA